MTVQEPDRQLQRSVQQLQIADRAYTETSQSPQQERTYLTGANTVYRAAPDSNNSENFKAYRALGQEVNVEAHLQDDFRMQADHL